MLGTTSLAMPAPAHRKKREHQTKFAEADLRKSLEPLAATKKVPWRWDGMHYSKPVRGRGPDREALLLSVPVLAAIAKVAPNGFPNLGCLRSVWISLDVEYQILESKSLGQIRTAQTACDIWRNMLKDCLALKTSKTALAPELQAVVDLLSGSIADTDSTSTKASIYPIPRNSEGFADFDQLHDDGSEWTT